MQKGDLPCDPRGLISESYRIEGISPQECRTIFMDWALGVPDDEDSVTHIRDLLTYYAGQHGNHPMTKLLEDGSKRSARAPKRRR